MKQIPLLQGKALLIELPDGATNPEVHTRSLTFDTQEVDEWGYDYQSVKLPPGNWRIIGMLSEVTEESAASIAEQVRVMNQRTKGYRTYNVDQYGNEGYFESAIKSLESAIEAEGYVFGNKLINPDDVCYFSRDRMIADVREYHEAQSRVLDRSMCLLLGRDTL